MFDNTMKFIIDSHINAMAVSRDGNQLAVAGRSLLKVYSLSGDSFGTELFNLRSSNLKNLNFSNSDVIWCPFDDGILATAATNGAVVVWNLQHSAKSKIEVVFNDHKRTVNKVCFHSNDSNYLLSGSQDGCMKLFDLRKKEAVATFVSNSESVRDVQFSPFGYSTNHFASVQETGNVEIWDIRRNDKPECNFIAHDGPVFACEWHPNQEYKWLATGGRDKTIKIWDLSNRSKPSLAYNVHTIAPVSKLKWRPTKDFHIGSCSLVVDFSVYVWDIKRPFVPYSIFGTKKDVTTGFAWKNDPYVFISTCKDCTVYQHRFETDAYYPAEHYPPIGIDLNPYNDIVYCMTDFIKKHSRSLSQSSSTNNQLSLVANESLSPSCRLIKTHSLGTNSIITPSGIMPGINGTSTSVNQQHQAQPHSLSSSFTQNWENPFAIDVKSRVSSVANHYFNSSFQQYATLPNPAIQFNLSKPPSSSSTAYNISVPISYKKTNETILTEHFRCMESHMTFFLSKEMTNLNEYTRKEISMEHFVYSAKFYSLSDRPFEELCEHNAQISDSLQRHQIAQTWRIVRHMFSIAGRHPTSSGGGGGNNLSGGSIPNMSSLSESLGISMPVGADYKMKSDNPSRHTSGGTRHFSGNNSTSNVNTNLNNQMAIRSTSNNQSFAMKDSSDDEDMKEIFENSHNYFAPLKQRTMPSNKFSVDFLEYQPNNIYHDPLPIHQHRGIENSYEYESNCQDWELQRESIFHRHIINDCSIQMNDLSSNNTGEQLTITNYEASSPVSFDEDDDLGHTPADSPGLFDINLQSLLSSKNQSLPTWHFSDIVSDMLRHYVNIGDVQTTVSIIMVLGDKMKQIVSIDKRTINIWIRAYIDLLHRFQLWNTLTRIIQLCPDPEIQGINQSSSSVLVYCAKCHKAIRHGSVQCEKCLMEPSNCAICHVSVRGLFTWCQGCAHGGHLQHMLEWFKVNSLCPAGCGHHCELC